MAKPSGFLWLVVFFLVHLLCFTAPAPEAEEMSIHDLLLKKGLPAGLLPKAVKSYTLDDSGRLEVLLDRPCLTKFENMVVFDSVVRANLSYGALTNVEGLTQEDLFLWFPVKDIIIDDPLSGLILFDIGVVHKRISRALFDYPPDCKQDGTSVLSLRSGLIDGGGNVGNFVA